MAQRTKPIGKIVLRILQSLLFIILSISCGIFVGLHFPEFSIKIKPIGDLFLSALKMCGLPIIVCAMVSSVGKLFSRGDVKDYLGKLLFVFFAGLFLSSILVVIIGTISEPGKGLSNDAMQALGKILSTAELSGNSIGVEREKMTIANFFIDMVPENIFSSLSLGENLRILIFCMFFGVALGLNDGTDASRTVVMGMDAAFEALIRLISWVMYAMPFGLFALFADQVANMGVKTLFSMGKMIAVFYGISTGLLFVGFFLISLKTNISFYSCVKALRECVFIAAGTRSSYASIPSALRGLHQELGVDKETSELVVPLSMSINPIGNIVYYGVGAIYFAQLSGLELHANEYLILVIGTVFAAVAGSALPGTAAIGVFAILMDPLGLHMGAATILLLAADPILDPLCTAVNVNSSCVASALVAPKSRNKSSYLDHKNRNVSSID